MSALFTALESHDIQNEQVALEDFEPIDFTFSQESIDVISIEGLNLLTEIQQYDRVHGSLESLHEFLTINKSAVNSSSMGLAKMSLEYLASDLNMTLDMNSLPSNESFDDVNSRNDSLVISLEGILDTIGHVGRKIGEKISQFIKWFLGKISEWMAKRKLNKIKDIAEQIKNGDLVMKSEDELKKQQAPSPKMEPKEFEDQVKVLYQMHPSLKKTGDPMQDLLNFTSNYSKDVNSFLEKLGKVISLIQDRKNWDTLPYSGGVRDKFIIKSIDKKALEIDHDSNGPLNKSLRQIKQYVYSVNHASLKTDYSLSDDVRKEIDGILDEQTKFADEYDSIYTFIKELGKEDIIYYGFKDFTDSLNLKIGNESETTDPLKDMERKSYDPRNRLGLEWFVSFYSRYSVLNKLYKVIYDSLNGPTGKLTKYLEASSKKVDDGIDIGFFGKVLRGIGQVVQALINFFLTIFSFAGVIVEAPFYIAGYFFTRKKFKEKVTAEFDSDPDQFIDDVKNGKKW